MGRRKRFIIALFLLNIVQYGRRRRANDPFPTGFSRSSECTEMEQPLPSHPPNGATQVLSFIEGKDLSKLPQQVAQLVSELEVNMGGTSGALYCIYLTALAGALAADSSVPKALKTALDSLCKYTKARLGDRTMMDALIPFIETLNSTNDGSQAIEKSKQGVEGTKQMQASLGRSTYLDESATQGVPDPGAYGLLILLQGMTTA